MSHDPRPAAGFALVEPVGASASSEVDVSGATVTYDVAALLASFDLQIVAASPVPEPSAQGLQLTAMGSLAVAVKSRRRLERRRDTA